MNKKKKLSGMAAAVLETQSHVFTDPEKEYEVYLHSNGDGAQDYLAGVFDNHQDAESFYRLLETSAYCVSGVKSVKIINESKSGYWINVKTTLEEACSNNNANEVHSEFMGYHEQGLTFYVYGDGNKCFEQIFHVAEQLRDNTSNIYLAMMLESFLCDPKDEFHLVPVLDYIVKDGYDVSNFGISEIPIENVYCFYSKKDEYMFDICVWDIGLVTAGYVSGNQRFEAPNIETAISMDEG